MTLRVHDDGASQIAIFHCVGHGAADAPALQLLHAHLRPEKCPRRAGPCREGEIFSRGWASCVWSESLLTYMAPVVMAAEFALADGAR